MIAFIDDHRAVHGVDGRTAVTGIDQDGAIEFADGSSWDSNLLRKPIKERETFSVGTNLSGKNGEDYWIYRVVSIIALP